MRRKPGGLQRLHWTILDAYDNAYIDRMLDAAPGYGVEGIQFSEDEIYWVNDSLTRYNAFAYTGRLCEKCHARGLKAYFWTHEICDFFQEFTTGAQYGFYRQLIGGRINLRANSPFWAALREKYEVFFRRLPGVDGVVLTLNESHVPVFREGVVDSDLAPHELVARLATEVKRACDEHRRELILRNFCYTPDEQERMRRGIAAIPGRPTLMMKCQPFDWHIHLPDDPMIAAYAAEYPVLVEYDLGHEFNGVGLIPFPDTAYLATRLAHARSCGAAGAAARLDRFRTHAEGTLNWSSVHTFARMALDPSLQPAAALRDYTRVDYPGTLSEQVAAFAKDLFAISASLFYLRRYWFCSHSNPPDFPKTFRRENHRGPLAWSPDDPRAQDDADAMQTPRPAHIDALIAEQLAHAATRDRWTAFWRSASDADLTPGDLAYLRKACARLTMFSEVVWRQQQVVLMVRHDSTLPAGTRRYTSDIESHCRYIEASARERECEWRVIGAEGNQHLPEILESFCIGARAAFSS